MDSVVGEDPSLPLNIDSSIPFPNLQEMPNRFSAGSNSLSAGEATAHNDNKQPSTTTLPFPSSAGGNMDNGTDDDDDASSPRFSDGLLLPSLDASIDIDKKMSPRTHRNIKDYGAQISDLKKENFSLKLRIYYMEERMQKHYSADLEQVVRKNIELNVECDSLKKDLQEKHDLLVKASNAVKYMEGNMKPDELHQAQQTIAQFEEAHRVLNEKLKFSEQARWTAQQTAENVAQKALKYEQELGMKSSEMEDLYAELRELKDDAGRRHDNNSAPPNSSDDMEEMQNRLKEFEERLEEAQDELEEKESTIARLTECLSSKQTVIELLNEEKHNSSSQQNSTHLNEIEQLRQQLEEKEFEAKEAKALEAQARKDYVDVVVLHEEYQEHITEQQQRLDDFELATKQMTEELDKRETDLKEVKRQLQIAKENADARQDEMENQVTDETNKLNRELLKRDRAVLGLTKMVKAKEEEIEKLQTDIKEFEQKAEDLADALHKFEMQKPHMAGKEKVIGQLRGQLHESDQALQEVLDNKAQSEEIHERSIRELRHQLMDMERQSERYKSELADNEETIIKLDGIIKEKDQDLQIATNKSKLLSRDFKLKDDECHRLTRERDDVKEQLFIEKRRFGELADKLLSQQNRDGNQQQGDDQLSVSATQRMWELEDKLREKESELHERSRERDKAMLEATTMRRELDRFLQKKEDEMNEKKDEIALKNNKIVTLTSSLEKSNVLRRQAEEKLLSETEEFKRLNDQLHEKWLTCKSDLEKLRAEKLRSDSDEQEQGVLIRQLYDELEAKDKEIHMLHNQHSRPVYILEEEFSDATIDYEGELVAKRSYDITPHDGMAQSGDQITYSYNVINQSQTQSQMQGAGERLQLMSSSSVNENKHVRMHEDIKQVQSSVDEINRTLTTRNETVNTTFGNVLDQTSYLQIQPQLHLSAEDTEYLEMGVNDLRRVLRETKNHLNETVRDYTRLSELSNDQVRQIQELQEKLSSVEIDHEKLITEQRQNLNEKMNKKEQEVVGLLQRLKDVETNKEEEDKKQSNKISRRGEAGDSVPSTPRSRRRSLADAEDSDGMTALTRRELNEIIGNLKKELRNAEKINSLKKIQNERAEKEASRSSVENEKLIQELADELERVKDKLHEAEIKELDRTSAMTSHSPIIRSRSALGKITSIEKSDLNRALSMNKKLKDRLSATEQTVRQQSEKLKKYASNSQLYCGPSPSTSTRMRSYASVPNLLDEDQADKNDAATQTNYDSGYSSQSSVNSLNSVIHQQSKELSNLRSQLQIARSAYKQLNSQMDVLSNYINSLLSSGGDAIDPYTASDVADELARSRRIVKMVRKSLGGYNDHHHMSRDMDDYYISDGSATMSTLTLDSDVPSPSLARIHNHQISRLTNQLANRNKMISDLQHDSNKRHNTSLPARLERTFASHSINDSRMGYSVSKMHNGGMNTSSCHGVLTPSTSLNSLLTDEEISALKDVDTSECSFPHNSTVAPYPSCKMNRSLSSSRSDLTRILSMRQRRTSDIHENGDEAVKFSADFNGAWKNQSTMSSRQQSPRKIRFNKSKNDVMAGESSCDDVTSKGRHQQEREMERLRRRLNDIKRLNKSLKEELDISAVSLRRAKEQFENEKHRHRHPSGGNSQNYSSGFDALMEHLNEIRGLRRRLEKSIETNDLLREKLEEKIRQKEDESCHLVCDNCEAASRELVMLKQQLSKTEDLSESWHRRLTSSESEVEKLRNELMTCRKDLSASETNGYKLKHDVANSKERNRMLTKTLEEAQQELQKQNSVSGQLVSAAEEKEAEVRKLKKQVEKCDAEKKVAFEEAGEAQNLATQFEQEIGNYQAKLRESDKWIASLKSELKLHERLQESHNNQSESGMKELLDEIRSLRVQLERSIDTNAALRRQLEDQIRQQRLQHQRDNMRQQDEQTTTININHITSPSKSSPHNTTTKKKDVRRMLKLDTSKRASIGKNSSTMMTPPESASSFSEEAYLLDEQRATLPSTCNRNNNLFDQVIYQADGPYRVCRHETLDKLERIINESNQMTRDLDDDVTHQMYSTQATSPSKVDLTTFMRIVTSIGRQLDSTKEIFNNEFWSASLSPHRSFNEDHHRSYSSCATTTHGKKLVDDTLPSDAAALRMEVLKLRGRLTKQDRLLQSTVDRLKSQSRMKEGIEDAIVRQLRQNCHVLKEARGNLEQNLARSVSAENLKRLKSKKLTTK